RWRISRCPYEHVVGSGNHQQVGDGSAVPAAGRPESERGAGASPVPVAGRVPAAGTCLAPTAGHLEQDEHKVATLPARYGVSPCRDLCDRFMSDRERPRKDTEGCHRPVKVAACDRERPNQDGILVNQVRWLDVLPLNDAWLD